MGTLSMFIVVFIAHQYYPTVENSLRLSEDALAPLHWTSLSSGYIESKVESALFTLDHIESSADENMVEEIELIKSLLHDSLAMLVGRPVTLNDKVCSPDRVMDGLAHAYMHDVLFDHKSCQPTGVQTVAR